MTARARKRRSPGEGSVWEYSTQAGQVRYAIGYVVTAPDGSTRSVTRRRGPAGEKWTTYRDAAKALRDALGKIDKGEYSTRRSSRSASTSMSGRPGCAWRASTVASYRKNIRLHLKPQLGAVPLRSLTTARIDAHVPPAGGVRPPRPQGRRDWPAAVGPHGPLRRTRSCPPRSPPRSKSGRLARNPAATAHPPTAKQAKSPEMHGMDRGAAGRVPGLGARDGHAHDPAWHTLAHTGMRRGEVLALRWRDIDLDAGTVSVRRSAGMIRNAGEGAEVTEGDTKSGKPRVVDIDPATVAVLRAHRQGARRHGAPARPR